MCHYLVARVFLLVARVLLNSFYGVQSVFFVCYVVASKFWLVARTVLGFYCCKGGHHNARVVARASLCSF